MRTLFMTAAAALAALALAGVAIAGQAPDPTEAVSEVEQAQDAAATAKAKQAEASQKAEAATEQLESREAKDKPDAAAKGSQRPKEARGGPHKAGQQGKAANGSGPGKASGHEPFGQIRKAEVHAAKEAGEPIEPAWKNPAHPTGGPERAAREEAEPQD